jgi:hypothetical protein
MLKTLEVIDHCEILHSILTEYHRDHDLGLVPVKVDFLKSIIERRGIADRIDLFEVTFLSQTLAASIEIFDTVNDQDKVVARIKVASTLDDYWKRIAICKEMYHCMIDCTVNLRVKSVDDLMLLTEGLTSRFSTAHFRRLRPDINPYNPLDTEAEAEFLALETLMPYELRRYHFESYHRGETSGTQLATRYRIPEPYIPIAMGRQHMRDVEKMRKNALVQIR